jgi:hypothetical protein
MLATFLVFGIGRHRSAGCPRSAKAQRIKEVLSDLKSSERAFHSSAERIQRQSRTTVDGKSQIDRVAPSIAQKCFKGRSIAISIGATVVSRARGS